MKTFIAAIFIFCLTEALAKFSFTNGRIINGFDASRRQFPYQVSLQALKKGKFVHGCGGSLISTTRVLTAAHCLITTEDRAVFGMLIQDEDYDHPDVQIRNITKVIGHPKYATPNENLAVYDIMILHLSSPVTISFAVQIAPLGTQEDCDAIEDTVASGWGLTNSKPPISPKHLKYVTIQRMSLEECKHFYPDLEKSDQAYGLVVCTSVNPDLIQSTCSGDSGGPLVRKSNKRLIGVTSLGPYPCETGTGPTLYSSVCKHREFINNS